jgi:hypothetical protein
MLANHAQRPALRVKWGARRTGSGFLPVARAAQANDISPGGDCGLGESGRKPSSELHHGG